MDFGTLARDGDLAELRYELSFDRPAETLWAALTEPARLDDWMSPALVEPFVGGRYELFLDRVDPASQMHGRILIWDPPRLLEYSWFEKGEGRGRVRAEITPQGQGCRLVFTHGSLPDRFVDSMTPGWHLHLDRLDAALKGPPIPIDMDAYRELRRRYGERYGFEVPAG